MEENWHAAASRRTRARLRARRAFVVPPGAAPIPVEAEDLDTLEDVFATVQLPIGVLNMDCAGNNIRNVRHVREVLATWEAGRTGHVTGKQRSELNLLGFAEGTNLTSLGRQAAQAASEEEVARLWCAWLRRTDDAALRTINPAGRLLAAKRVLPQFWRLRREVRDYFLTNAEGPDRQTRQILQTIELLCNGSDVVQVLSLEDIRTLSPLLERPPTLPGPITDAIVDYQGNKGVRGWRYPDRRILPLAWREAAGGP